MYSVLYQDAVNEGKDVWESVSEAAQGYSGRCQNGLLARIWSFPKPKFIKMQCDGVFVVAPKHVQQSILGTYMANDMTG